MTKTKFDFKEKQDIAWCPGCGNFALLNILKSALEELEIESREIVISSGIGQAAKMPQYINNINYYNGLHGRALPVAAAIKMANPNLTVIAEGGDGDMYGEGGNHFLHNIRRNLDILHIVHNNQVYGLTKGQGSPTSSIGQKTSLQVEGVYNEPFNPLATAISLGASFVARSFTGDAEKCKEIIKAGIKHKGYALIDIFDPCITFNKINTFKWYKENTYYVDIEYDPTNKIKALEKSYEDKLLPLGIIYKNPISKKTFHENLAPYKNGDLTPLYKRNTNLKKIEELLYKI